MVTVPTLAGGGGRVTVGDGGGRRRAACGALPRAKCSAASAQAAPGKNHCRITLNTASSRSNTRRWRRVRRAGERGAKHQSPTGTPRMGWRRAPPRVQRTNHHARRRARRAVAHGGDGSGLRSNGELFHSIGPFERTPRSSGLHRAAPSLQASPCAGARFDSACSAPSRARLLPTSAAVTCWQARRRDANETPQRLPWWRHVQRASVALRRGWRARRRWTACAGRPTRPCSARGGRQRRRHPWWAPGGWWRGTRGSAGGSPRLGATS